jgi:hypothetical protein
VPDLNFEVEKAEPLLHAAAPQLAFKLRIRLAESAQPAAIESILLRCQIRIEPTRRRYTGEDPQRLVDLFGEPDRWRQTMRSMLWTHAQVIVLPFVGTTVVDLPVPCTYDFNVAATKYFAALQEGDVPLCLLFSGTVFYQADDGRLQVAPISWDKQADFRLPVSVWRQMMDHYYPNTVWLGVPKEVFDRLAHYRSQHGLPTWQQALENLLASQREQVPS